METIKNGKKYITQKYVIGLYVAVYDLNNHILDQFGLRDTTEEQFHNRMRSIKDESRKLGVKWWKI